MKNGKPRKPGDAMPRFTMPEPEGTIKAPPPDKAKARAVSPKQSVIDFLGSMEEIAEKDLAVYLRIAADFLKLDQSSRPDEPLSTMELLKLGLAGPKREFLLDAIDLAGCVGLTSRKVY